MQPASSAQVTAVQCTVDIQISKQDSGHRLVEICRPKQMLILVGNTLLQYKEPRAPKPNDSLQNLV